MSETVSTRIIRYEDGVALKERGDLHAREEPLEIRIEGRTITLTMRTPGADRELAAGFLLSEGIVKSAKDIFDITTCIAAGKAGAGNAVDVGLTHPGTFDAAKLSRHVFTTSSCGLCGKTTIDSVMKRHRALRDRVRISAELLLSLPRRLSHEQKTFQSTGGLHACALFDPGGKLIAVREDVGRHNALDKLTGFALLEKLTPLRGHIVLLSGRASFEMMQKSHAAGIPVVAAISAPSSLAVEFAKRSGQTLAGFLRGRSMNVYAGGRRIV